MNMSVYCGGYAWTIVKRVSSVCIVRSNCFELRKFGRHLSC